MIPITTHNICFDLTFFHYDGLSHTYIGMIIMELSILYFKGLQANDVIMSPKIVLSRANSANLDKMSPYMAFHLSHPHLPKYLFTDIQNEKG